MRREQLSRIVRRAAEECGYAFHEGEAHKMNGTIRAYPAAWLEPPTVKSVKGHTECEAVYKFVLHLATLAPTAENMGLWSALEKDAAAIMARIPEDEAVCSVAGITLTPARGGLTSHGEVSLTLSGEITMWYYL